MAFEGLSEKLNNVFKRLKGRGKLSEDDVKEAMREVRMALLEADVSYKVVKDFVAKVSERAVGTEVLIGSIVFLVFGILLIVTEKEFSRKCFFLDLFFSLFFFIFIAKA